MLRFKIYYEGSYNDSITVSGETLGEIREKAFAESDKRGWERHNCWSEKLKEESENE